MSAGLIALIAVAIVVLIIVARTVRIVPQARAGIVERLGRYQRTLNPGLNLLIPLVDRLLPLIDLREQVVSFPPQAVITSDNVGVSIDTVVYYRVIDARASTYEIAQPIQAIEQLTVTTLRNLIGGLDLEQALTSRDEINNQLRTALDEATGPWGIRISRVELKAIDPPPTIQEAMEMQMRAERTKRAVILEAQGGRESAILSADGQKEAAILEATGAKEAAILKAEGQKQSEVLRAEGEAQAIGNVFTALRAGEVSENILSYLYLDMLPRLADNQANKVFVIPTEFTDALNGLGAVAQRANRTPSGP